jgi:hypothetical protein
MDEDQLIHEALLPPRTSARVKCTCGEDTPQWEAFPWLKQTYGGDSLHSVKCIYGQRHTQFSRPTTMTMMTTMTSQSTIVMDNQSLPTISMIFDCNDINGNGGFTWLLLPTDRISSGHPAAPRLWLRAIHESQPRLPIFSTGETTLWFETTTSRGTTFRTLIGGSNQSMRYG